METTAEFLQVKASLFDLLVKYQHLVGCYLGFEAWEQSIVNKILKVEKNQWHNFFLITNSILDYEILCIDNSWYILNYLLTGWCA